MTNTVTIEPSKISSSFGQRRHLGKHYVTLPDVVYFEESTLLNANGSVIEKLEPEHRKNFTDALEIMSAVLAGKSLEAAFTRVRANVNITLKNGNSNDMTAAMEKTFSPYYGMDHLETIEFKQEITKDEFGTFVVHVSKLGMTALGRREIDGMLNGTIPKPEEYKFRKEINGKRAKARDFLTTHFGKFITAKALYAHELKALNPSLYLNLVNTVVGGISSLMPTKSEKITADLATLEHSHPAVHKTLSRAYAR